MDLMNMDPEIVFKPERRKMEYRFLKDQREEIDRLDIHKDDKIFMKRKLQDYYEEFDEKFTEYHRMVREYNMWNALGALNKKMEWHKDN